jgi:DNA-directed RNA polymerase specialized sigma24 family protein
MQYVERSRPARIGATQMEDPEAQLAREEWQASVWADVAGLPSRQRIAVTLRFAEGMTYQQIGEATGCAPGTAKTRVHHGLKRLKERFGKETFDGTPGRPTEEASSRLPRSRETQPAIEMTSKS